MKQVDQNDLYAGLVTVLSKLIDAEKRAGGTQRSGGDYSREALAMIERTKAQLGYS